MSQVRILSLRPLIFSPSSVPETASLSRNLSVGAGQAEVWQALARAAEALAAAARAALGAPGNPPVAPDACFSSTPPPSPSPATVTNSRTSSPPASGRSGSPPSYRLEAEWGFRGEELRRLPKFHYVARRKAGGEIRGVVRF